MDNLLIDYVFPEVLSEEFWFSELKYVSNFVRFIDILQLFKNIKYLVADYTIVTFSLMQVYTNYCHKYIFLTFVQRYYDVINQNLIIQ